MGLYTQIMGAPVIYDKIRPFFLGGFDFSQVYGWLNCTATDIIVDVGCGTGHALEYLHDFASYHGFDVDERATAVLAEKYGKTNPKIHVDTRIVQASDIAAIGPSCIIMMGLLHHLTNDECKGLLNLVAACPTPVRAITLDPCIVPGRIMSRILGSLDRGKFVRKEPQYRQLIADAGLKIVNSEELHSGSGMATYFATCLSHR